MDAVTHQPLGKQAAIKGPDGVFYWDLNRKPEITPGGVMPTKTEYVGNMRQAYDTWYKTMQEQDAVLAENNPTMVSLLQRTAAATLAATSLCHGISTIRSSTRTMRRCSTCLLARSLPSSA